MHTFRSRAAASLLAVAGCVSLSAQELGASWGTADREAEHYRIVEVPVPESLALECGSFCPLSNGRLAIGTRRGEILIVSGAFDALPRPEIQRFAEGLDEVLGLGVHNGVFYATQQTELTRITDVDGDGRADRFENLSDVWGFGHYHEFAWGSGVQPDGSVYVVLGLSDSYNYKAPYRGFAFRIDAEGSTSAVASGIRSAGGVGPNESGEMFYVESQGPWNGSCSLKHLQQGGFMGHPVCFPGYDLPLGVQLGPKPVKPNTPSRLVTECARVPQLVPYAVVFPYRRMGQSITGFRVDRSRGRFGPFAGQLFVSDYSLSLVMRATTEQVRGVWQGACYPFREGLGNGILAIEFSDDGYLITGGTNRGWPVRGNKRFVLERLEYTGRVPFEVHTVSALHDGFHVRFTLPVDATTAAAPDSYRLRSFTHIYRQGYGSPEVDETVPTVAAVAVDDDGLGVRLTVQGLVEGHVHDLHFDGVRDTNGASLVHTVAYYTLNRIPE
ncbi:MAG: hypothetical protein H6835_09605 [Planctomycetes bacterium]|nr:hypothetical protein [Planctomycetota bacterium]